MNMLLKENYLTERELRNYRWRIRRRKELRQKYLNIFFTIILILVLAISIYAIKSNANTEISGDGEVMSYKYYTSVLVKYGDTLWTIAEEYMDEQHYECIQDFLLEVVHINRLTGKEIKAGNYLIVPYFSQEYVNTTHIYLAQN